MGWDETSGLKKISYPSQTRLLNLNTVPLRMGRDRYPKKPVRLSSLLVLLTYCLCASLVVLLVVLWLIIMSRRIHDPELGRSDSEEVEIETRVLVKRLFQTRFRLALEQLPPPTKNRSRRSSSSSSQGTSIDGGCPICLEDFEEGEACQVIPECNHIFHLPCIGGWLVKKQICPVRRRLLLPRRKACKFPIPLYWTVYSHVEIPYPVSARGEMQI